MYVPARVCICPPTDIHLRTCARLCVRASSSVHAYIRVSACVCLRACTHVSLACVPCILYCITLLQRSPSADFAGAVFTLGGPTMAHFSGCLDSAPARQPLRVFSKGRHLILRVVAFPLHAWWVRCYLICRYNHLNKESNPFIVCITAQKKK